MIESSLEQYPVVDISAELGYRHVATESVSSQVFERDGMIYKLNGRTSLIRQQRDLTEVRRRFADFSEHIPESKVAAARYGRTSQTCVIQPKIPGAEIKRTERAQVIDLLQSDTAGNKAFVQALLEDFFTSIGQCALYPDIVGFPEDPDFFNSINILVEEGTGRFMLCDVGLSPHENTISRFGTDFYKSLNVQAYVRKMREFQSLLHEL